MLRGPSRWVSWVAIVGVGAGVAVVALARAPHRGPTALDSKSLVTASSQSNPRSCKPSAPVLVRLASTSQPDVWHVHLEALATVESVEISLGAMASGRDIARRVMWTGTMTQGETRDLVMTFAPPQDASNVWAEAAAGTDSMLRQRGRAAIALRDGRPTAAAAEPLGGRLTIDPESGQKVIEFVGSSEASR